MSDQNSNTLIIFLVIGICLFIFFKIRSFFHTRMGQRAKEMENRGAEHYKVFGRSDKDSTTFSWGESGNQNEYTVNWTSANIMSLFLTVVFMALLGFLFLKSCGT